jgi:hypothetical protein
MDNNADKKEEIMHEKILHQLNAKLFIVAHDRTNLSTTFCRKEVMT